MIILSKKTCFRLDCGGPLLNLMGVIESPKVNSSVHSMECTWFMFSGFDKPMTTRFILDEINILPAQPCSSQNIIEIYGFSEHYKNMYSYCGSNLIDMRPSDLQNALHYYSETPSTSYFKMSFVQSTKSECFFRL